MDKFKKQIINRRRIFVGLAVISFMLVGLDFLGVIEKLVPESYPVHIADFQIGILFGIAMMMSYYVRHYTICLKNEKKLKLLYNESKDERIQLIHQKAGLPLVNITSLMMIVVGSVAGYFNELVFITLIAAAVIQLLIVSGVKIYYSKVL